MVTTPDMLWLVIASGVACFFMAFVTGANDIANTFSTSIGSKALTIKRALIIAFFFEALGASLLGGTVTDSIRSKIINFEAFYDAPEFLMLGMFCALMGATMWLAIATCLGLPVSTTHSIVGALLGFGLAAGHSKSIKWEKIHSIVISWFAAPILAGSCSAIAFSIIRHLILRRRNSFEIIKRWYWFLIFLITLPFSVFLVFQNPIVLNVPCTMKKGTNLVIESPCYIQDWTAAHPFYSTIACLVLSSILTCIGSAIIYVVYNKRMNNFSFRKKLFGDDMINDLEKNGKNANNDTICNMNNSSLNSVASNETRVTQQKGVGGTTSQPGGISGAITTEAGADSVGRGNFDTSGLHCEKRKNQGEQNYQTVISMKNMDDKNEILETKKSGNLPRVRSSIASGTNSVNSNISQSVIENFDQETEIVFSSLQIISAILGVVAQSANDTANAIGPFAAVFNTYNNGIKGKLKVQWYILLFGGLSMSLGLSVLGYRVIRTVGMKLIRITPSRGFTIELISGLVVLLFSICGIPLSSTHCAVSSVIGVGLVEAKISEENDANVGTNNQEMNLLGKDMSQVDKNANIPVKKKNFLRFLSFLNTSCVNLKLFRTIFFSWIITVSFSATVTAAIFSFAAYSPSYIAKAPVVVPA
ncbi:sodium-dependent phosphate transporter, putative [Plasmodium knowlesi strain H]|uniref:Phosphate transporter n=3 Tax=Plasmodium knowlesi TaxID=5850 RepID=A0A5K1VCU7_PLAKH|nr:sodium-dependent phosphate transporter, putative [Plasmodium knowlesi strain H]OTN66144.1 Phosphate transporter [Plasmodium knowlesi]CAA9989927.1 sodium-dependent phosphate transporter, putative [Plasmodium knowlesi strain H]SBO24501.1 sodium-dependent phosphate transporter, putative [Plasmodium knowlesi strain H]SBO26450.1 sodium-dependent phosphate transporter, putative [Plasmodium knowlesi strain H]VVS79401.1 sodium-dependent phosphate transporter, putative [Plasmodium knowlesi strain H]|eukprot:XP_002259943.1 phosphate transporter, putative [Plasmodium knowlesi strain H]